VYNFESGRELTVENAQSFPTQHPRCGTSFLFIIMIVAILSFAVLDAGMIHYVGELKVWMRLAYHIPFIPIVAGMGYEVLKFTARHRDNILCRSQWFRHNSWISPGSRWRNHKIKWCSSCRRRNKDEKSGRSRPLYIWPLWLCEKPSLLG